MLKRWLSSSPGVLWILNVRERNPDRKKNFHLNKYHEPNIQIQWQHKVFNQRFERWIYYQQLLGTGWLPKWKIPSAKIQLLNIFNNHLVVAYSGPTAVGNDRWEISNALWRRFYYGYGKYRPELSEFKMYRCHLNFALFCAKSSLGISSQHLNHPNLLARSVYQFHV